MPPKLPAASIAPEKNARFSGRFDRCTLASSASRVVARPLEGLADGVEVRVAVVAHHAVALEQALHEARDDLRVLLGEAAVHHQDVGDDEQVRLVVSTCALPPLSSTTSETFGSHVTHPASWFAPDLMSRRNSSPAATPSSV